MKSRKFLSPLLPLTALAVAMTLPAFGTAAVTASPYVAPRPGLVTSGTDKHIKVTLQVSKSNTFGQQNVNALVDCFGTRLGATKMRITYTHYSAGKLHADFATPLRKGRPFGISGYFKTPTAAQILLSLSPAAQPRCLGIVVKGFSRFVFRLGHVIHIGGTPPNPPSQPPPGPSVVTLTQCPMNTRDTALAPDTPFVVRGQVSPAQAGLWLNVTYVTAHSPAPAPVLAQTAADGTFSANFTVPHNPGLPAGAEVNATLGTHSAVCQFWDL